jgi:hypothetical protein
MFEKLTHNYFVQFTNVAVSLDADIMEAHVIQKNSKSGDISKSSCSSAVFDGSYSIVFLFHIHVPHPETTAWSSYSIQFNSASFNSVVSVSFKGTKICNSSILW